MVSFSCESNTATLALARFISAWRVPISCCLRFNSSAVAMVKFRAALARSSWARARSMSCLRGPSSTKETRCSADRSAAVAESMVVCAMSYWAREMSSFLNRRSARS